MASFLSSVTERGLRPALEKALVFNEARLKMIAENVANLHTPGYRAKQLDTAGFQKSLGDAIKTRDKRTTGTPLTVNHRKEVKTDARGSLHVKPSLVPVENVLFHDGTNLSIERQMSDLAETGMVHELTSTLLRGQFDGLRKAIRGTVA